MAFLAAMDTHTPKTLGEKGHAQYGQSHDLQERIVQLSFQIVRTSADGAAKIANEFVALWQQATSNPELREMLCRLLIQTRDLEKGKGEWALSYAILKDFYNYEPALVKKMIYYMVHDVPDLEKDGTGTTHCFGSWKDIKALWLAFGGENCPADMYEYLVTLVNAQLRADVAAMTSGEPGAKVSLAGRWVAREGARKKSTQSFQGFYRALAEDYFSNYLLTATAVASRLKAKKKCYMDFRKLVCSPLNTYLKTTQVYQCAGKYSEIDYKCVSSVTMRKQTKAFMNKKKDGSQRSEAADRITGAERFEEFVAEATSPGSKTEIKGKRVGINKMVVDALDKVGGLAYYTGGLDIKVGRKGFSLDDTEVKVLNSQWRDAGKSLKKLGKMIPMCDLSGSMGGDPMNAAIGLSCRVAENSSLGKRILTFSTKPSWINVDLHPGEETTFVEMIDVISCNVASAGMGTNFTAALRLILDVIVQNKLPASEVDGLILAIFSDMQIDSGNNETLTDTMWEKIERLFHETGIQVCGEPYKPPHILFWNLRSTGGSPVLSSQKGATMFSGYSPALLNDFAENGVDAFRDFTPWNMLKQQLCSPRFDLHRLPEPTF
jgi:hypothetical protein